MSDYSSARGRMEDLPRFGADLDGGGVRFAVFSQNAEAVELCLFDRAHGEPETKRILMVRGRHGVWSARVEGIGPGQLYGYRAIGPYRPMEGHRFNPNKLLMDPYARAIAGRVDADDVFLGYDPKHPDSDLSFDVRDSGAVAPKSVVVEPESDWGDDPPPRTAWRDTVIYECHVKGMTAAHPEVAPELRGTYVGLASEPVLDHLRRLGVTAVELLPAQHFVDQREVLQRGLVNYWGYNTIGYFAPESRYARGEDGRQVAEFRQMVQRFHRAGIEVILDVVYNHTAEGDVLGPTLCFRGLDNAVYYRSKAGEPRFLDDVTGCGNTLNLRHPRVFQLVMDSLRHWVTEMHVDGFRLDLTPALLRGPHGADAYGALSLAVGQDPVLSKVKWIAEPWDLGHGGYELGRFPPPWAEWNDKYRDTVRRFWRGDAGQVAHFADRLAGSSDLFFAEGRGPLASVNFITCHDGFSLADLVSYEHKHNEANGENNQDGANHNYSRNWGEEGPTERAAVLTLRERARRNLVATLAFSLGVPMLSHGDELGRTQRGNNNAYCQDNELTWVNWNLDEAGREFFGFACEVLCIRRRLTAFRRDWFFEGRSAESGGPKDVHWLKEDGRELSEHDWHDPKRHVLGMLIHDIGDIDQNGRAFLLLLNGGAKSCQFVIPGAPEYGVWQAVVDTCRENAVDRKTPSGAVELLPRTLLLLEGETR